MSRIIVKQLPKNVTEEKLRSIFSTKGSVTDIQLKYTAGGKFRQFCFIGFQTETEAQDAIQHFNNSCIQTSRIIVELCSNLGAEEKSQTRNKHSKDNKEDFVAEKLANKKDVKAKDEKSKSRVDEILEKHKDDPEFQEFMKAHEKTRTLWANDANENIIDKESCVASDDNNSSTNDFKEQKEFINSKVEVEVDKSKLAEKPISDIEYMKSLMAKPESGRSKSMKGTLDLFTIKIHNVPYNIKRQEIIKFFKPLKPFSVRLPTNVHGFCYVGFKTEKDMGKAMLKNKSFIKGKQVFFSDFTEKNKITKAKQSGDSIDVLSGDMNPKWKIQEESLLKEEDISESGRIFFRNLAYTTTEDDLQKLFEQFGPVAEINLPVDSVTRQIKGFGTISFMLPEHAVRAFNALDGTTFHGRLLHLIPGKGNQFVEKDENDASLTFKQKKSLKLKKSAQQSACWNTLFLGPNTVAEILAKKFETSKQQILDTEDGGSSAAVRIALGETQIVIEMKKFLEDNGVRVNAFDTLSMERSKTIILVKNLPPDTKAEELTNMFAKFGPIGRLVLPPSGVTAIVEYCDASEARLAFKKLAYSKFKNVPLFLEWGPKDTFTSTLDGEPLIAKIECEQIVTDEIQDNTAEKENHTDKHDIMPDNEEEIDDDEPEGNTTLFLRNLNFKTVQETVCNHFKSIGPIHTVEIARRKDSNNPSATTSLGYGFIQFKKNSTAEFALKNMQFTTIDGNQVELKRSDRVLKAPGTHAQRKKVPTSKQTGTKILVRNIPFQAKVKEVRDVFKAFGELRSVRLPKKMTPGEDCHRGFGYVDFITKSEAKKAFDALSQSTHLYGRRLVLEWASIEDEDVHTLRKRSAEQFHSTSLGKSAKCSKRAVFNGDGNTTPPGGSPDDSD